MIDRRCQRRGQLAIVNSRRATFCFLTFSLFFLCFCCLHVMEGESTLQRGQKCCQIILISKGVHVWTSTMVILKHVFSNFWHNMVNHNTKNSIKKKFHFPNLYCVIPKYICCKQMYITMYSKNVNIFLNWLKWFLIFMKFVIFIKHYDSIWLE